MYVKYIFFNILSYFIKKDSNIWVFGAIRGQRYMDNAKYLFEYVNKNTNIEAIWLTNSDDVIDEVTKKGFIAYKIDSKEGRYYALRAKVGIVTHRGINDNADLPFYCFSKETCIVQLWHGLALKKIAFDDKVDGFRQDESKLIYKIKQKVKTILIPFSNYINSPSLLLALSQESKKIFSKAFRVDEKNVVITGYPRNDKLLQNTTRSNNIKNIIYMPTFRNNSTLSIDVDLLEIYLLQKDLKFFIKIHPFHKISDLTKQKIEKSKNIFILDIDDIYEELNRFDILITDYSSIYFDYLLLDRPIIFTPFDKNDYLEKERDFYYDYDSVTPGPKAQNWDEVLVHLDSCIDDSMKYANQREKIKDMFHKYKDSKASQRVFKTILDTIK
jgi:CDP-glycerol glycerophosphotransferase (TagB/SpsB family)